MLVTASGWVMKSSPERRCCPSCADSANAKARAISRVSALGLYARTFFSTGSIGEPAAAFAAAQARAVAAGRHGARGAVPP